MAEYDGKIVTLLACEGNKPGQPIATYVVGRRERYLVFLPNSALVGQQVRVKLVDTGKTDKRGSALYRGVPAPPEYTERWKDNGDGTATKVTIATDWLGQTSEEGVVKTKVLETREYPDRASTRTDRVVVWGSDLATSAVLKEQVTTIPTMSEYVDAGGCISHKQTSAREERSTPESLPVIRVRVWGGFYEPRRLEVAYEDSWSLAADCYCTDTDYVRENLCWGKLPVWLQAEVQAQYPVCGCGRRRKEAQADGYAKCELCRAEETCIRCNKKATVKNISGRLVCDKCQPYESAEQLIETSLPSERRKAIAKEATKLCAGQALPQEAGEMILKATLDHLASRYGKDNILQKWSGYGWYYFCEDGVFATKLAPAALQFLQFLPEAKGNGLVEMAAWISEEPKVKPGWRDFYVQSQVKGESGVHLPLITEELKVADFLRGSEADRVAALAGYQNLVSKLGEDHRETKAVAEILQEEKQDYAAALAKIREIGYLRETRQKRIDAGEIWPDVRVPMSSRSRTTVQAWCVLPDGSVETRDDGEFGDLPTNRIVISHEHDNYGYRETEKWEVHFRPAQATGITGLQAETVKRLLEESRHYFAGSGTGWNFSKEGMVMFTTAYHRDFAGREQELDNEMRANLPIDVSQWETEVGEDGVIVVGPYQYTTAQGKAVRKAEEETEFLRGELMNLDHEKQEAATGYAQAEEEWLARQDAGHATAAVESGTVYLVPRFVKETSQGRESLAYGPFYDSPAGHQVKLVLDPFSQESARVSETSRDVLVRVRPRSSAQLHLFEGFLRPADGGHKQKTFGYFVKAVLGPKDLDSRIKMLEENLRQAEAHLAQLKEAAKKIEKMRKQDASVAEPPVQGSGLGTMADAFKKAGLTKE